MTIRWRIDGVDVTCELCHSAIYVPNVRLARFIPVVCQRCIEGNGSSY